MILGVREQVDLPEGLPYRVLRWKDSFQRIEQVLSPYRSVAVAAGSDDWHYHQAFQLTHFAFGEGMRFVGDHIAPFGPGDLVLLGENLPHCWHTRGASTGMSVQWWFASSHAIWGFSEAAPLAAFFQSAARGIHFRGRTAEILRAQLQRLMAAEGLARLGLLLQVFATAASAPADDRVFLSTNVFSLPGESRHQTATLAAIRFLLAHFRDEVRLEQLLEVTGMSKPTFCRVFKTHSGKSLNEFLQQLRLEAACRDLAESDRSVIDVALGSGFSQVSFFNRVFQRKLNCSPTRYRADHRARAKTGEE